MQPVVLYVDADILVINKPAGLPTLPDGYSRTAPYVGSVLKAEYGRIYFVHRLDKETSGVLVLARNAAAHKSLNTQFEHHDTGKIYHALVVGVPEWESHTVDVPLLTNGDRHHRTVFASNGKPAVTHLCLLERFHGYSLIEARPETGRTHQIRAHLSIEGFPIVADELYGFSVSEGLPVIERTALHAWQLSLEHPVSEKSMTFEAPYPEDFAAALELLRRRGK